ncbi:3-oxoacyl-[acyl-carrier-protein] reductase FabG-like isoform X1 [Vigna umbellata]|uniref:3-oxoacyl-[acyl-carrier-protein] reductase FabG-like isoform X1 n=1 Tax=Vigna umbellata TaxID=87088 RepID=UPI001F5F319D|nr:3-oxoacyl-[acyl-carrier-protein] reductase FabG-like isoform X1 [Vigna umbellata]
MNLIAAEQVLEPWHKLEDKVVLVTGASSGIGRDFCIDLAKAGSYVVAAARRLDRLTSLCHEINRLWPSPAGNIRAVPVELDVASDASTIDKAVQKAWDAFGRIDSLINNAGVRGSVKSPLRLSEEEWDQVFKTNVTGCWLVSKYVCKRMCDAQIKGSVINVSSVAGLNRGQLPGAVAYASSKAGVNMLTKVMAMELGVHKVRVNSICPGIFKSEITENLMQKKWLEGVIRKIMPLRRLGTSDPALTSLVRYLIHDSSEYVTGNNFVVDFGATLPGVPIYSSL